MNANLSQCESRLTQISVNVDLVNSLPIPPHILAEFLAPRRLDTLVNLDPLDVQALAQQLQHFLSQLRRLLRPPLFDVSPLLEQRTDILVPQAKGKLLGVSLPRQALVQLVTGPAE